MDTSCPALQLVERATRANVSLQATVDSQLAAAHLTTCKHTCKCQLDAGVDITL